MLAKLLQASKNRVLRGSISFLHDIGSLPVLNGNFKQMPEKVQKFVAEKASLMKPRALYICDGSPQEYKWLVEELVKAGRLKPLPGTGPGVYLSRSDPEDTKRSEGKTVICTAHRSATEATEEETPSKLAQWIPPEKLGSAIDNRFPGCMNGRVMYVVPFSMGPLGGKHSMNSVQVTDCAYVVAHMHILNRVNSDIWQAMGDSDFVECVHSVGLPKPVTAKLHQNWLCNISQLFIGHDMDNKRIWSFGSSSIGNAMLGKKCLSLRMGSAMGRDEGWLAEHMAIISVTNPEGQEFFVGVSFPSGSGKTITALMKPRLPGWKIQAIGDDAAWLRFNEEDGRMYAVNPENGMYGIACGTNHYDNPIILDMTSKDTIYTNIAETIDGRRWWQGIDAKGFEEAYPENVSIINWLGRELGPLKGDLLKLQQNISGDNNKIAQSGARFAVRCRQVPNIHPQWENSRGVPLSALIFGCRRSEGVPLVTEATSWKHGVFMAASARSETANKERRIQSDPMGMRPFMGYNFADYINHWMSMEKPGRKMPKVFFVNWYRRDASSDGLLWPGFSDNIRILDWITRRSVQASSVKNSDSSVETELGNQPDVGHFNLEGLDNVDWGQLMSVPKEFWEQECDATEAFFKEQMGKHTPQEMVDELNELRLRIKNGIPSKKASL